MWFCCSCYSLGFPFSAPNQSVVLVRFTDEQVRHYIYELEVEGRDLRERDLLAAATRVGRPLTDAESMLIDDPWGDLKLFREVEPSLARRQRVGADMVTAGGVLRTPISMQLDPAIINHLNFSTTVSAAAGATSVREELDYAWYLRHCCGGLDLVRVRGDGSCLFEALMKFIRFPLTDPESRLEYTPLHLRRQLIVALIYHR